MFPTFSTFPDTFEQFVEQHNIPADHVNREGWQRVYEREVEVAANAPTTIPACPWWCSEPAGHDYTSTDGRRGEPVDYQRFHTHPVGQLSVDTIEHNRDGVVTLDPVEVYVDERNDFDAAAVRALAADLLAAADLLDRINGAPGTPVQRVAAARVADVARHHDGVTDEQRQAATALLADLYAVGARHGVEPEHFAAVTALPTAAVDVVLAAGRRAQR